MGNSIRRVGLLSTFGAGESEPFDFQLGRKVSIHLSKREFRVKRGGSWSEKWTMTYTVDLSTSILSLTRSGKEDEGATGLHIELFSETFDRKRNISEYGYDLDVETVTESDGLVSTNSSSTINGNSTSAAFDYSRHIHEGGRVTETDLYLFGTGDIGGLNVLEKKKKKIEEEEPYAVTLGHYFAASAGINDFSRTKTDVGLSVVVKIRVTNGNLDITVEGPEQHPVFGLRYLFGEAMRTKVWKPTLCPHCANIQMQRSTMTWPSDSDDSESVPVARRHGGSQKRTVKNGGLFNGNRNGNYEENCIKNKYVYYFLGKKSN